MFFSFIYLLFVYQVRYVPQNIFQLNLLFIMQILRDHKLAHRRMGMLNLQ